jgi:hypothetical protein
MKVKKRKKERRKEKKEKKELFIVCRVFNGVLNLIFIV